MLPLAVSPLGGPPSPRKSPEAAARPTWLNVGGSALTLYTLRVPALFLDTLHFNAPRRTPRLNASRRRPPRRPPGRRGWLWTVVTCEARAALRALRSIKLPRLA